MNFPQNHEKNCLFIGLYILHMDYQAFLLVDKWSTNLWMNKLHIISINKSLDAKFPPHGKNLKIENTFESFGIRELSQARNK